MGKIPEVAKLRTCEAVKLQAVTLNFATSHLLTFSLYLLTITYGPKLLYDVSFDQFHLNTLLL